jgi:hypothetical protein
VGEVRLSPPITILSIVATSLGTLGWLNQKALSPDRIAACSIALDYFQRSSEKYGNHVLIIESIDLGFSDASITRDRAVAPKSKENDQEFQIAERQLDLVTTSPVSDCPNVLHWLAENRIGHVASIEAARSANWHPPQGPQLSNFIGISMPAIIEELGIARFKAATVYGDAAIQYHRLSDGNWNFEWKIPGAVN